MPPAAAPRVAIDEQAPETVGSGLRQRYQLDRLHTAVEFHTIAVLPSKVVRQIEKWVARTSASADSGHPAARRIFAIVSTISIPTSAPRIMEASVDPQPPGSRLDADHPENGVLIPRRNTADGLKDPAFAAEALALPLEVYVAEQLAVIDPDGVHQVRLAMRRFLGERLKVVLRKTYDACAVAGRYSPDAVSAGRRALRNLCLAYQVELADAESRALCLKHLQQADNMTDALAALTALANCDCPERKPALEQFYLKWQDEPLVVDKWLGVEAMSRLPGTVVRVKELTSHPAFTLKNPNKVYALLGSFAVNQVNFHAADGSGYTFMGEQILALAQLSRFKGVHGS